MEKKIYARGHTYTLEHTRWARGERQYLVYFNGMPLNASPLPENKARALAHEHSARLNKLGRGKRETPKQEIRNPKSKSRIYNDNRFQELEAISEFLQFTACDFDVEDLKLL